MEHDELKKILADHKLWLSNKGGRHADLSLANLRGADIRGADIRWADLNSADLQEADLSSANLSGADLRWANLSCANLSCANLSGAKLIGAKLSAADMKGANLRWADLQEADPRDIAQGDDSATLTVTDADYKPVQPYDDELIVEHKLWPVSYLSDEGDVVNGLWSFDPTNTLDNRFQVNEPITVMATHIRVELPEGE